MKRILITSIAWTLACTAWLAVALPADAAATSKVLGADGTLYSLHLGSSDDLSLSGSGDDTFLAALQVTDQSGKSSWHIVPDSDLGQNRESAATLLLEPATETLFLVWETRVNFIHSILSLASFQEGEWSEVTQIRGGWLTPRSAPQAVVTRDEYPAMDDSGTINRVVLHLVWWEANEDGEQVLYTPVILENGSLVEIQDALVVGDLPTLGDVHPEFAVADSLARAPTIRSAADANTVLIGFADAATGLQRTVEVRAIPGQLTTVADELRARIVDFSVTHRRPVILAQAAKDAVLEAASSLHPSVQLYLGEQVYQLISSTPAGSFDPHALAEEAHRLVLEVGDSISGRGLVNFTDGLRARIVDFSSSFPTETSPSQSFTFRPISDRPAPLTPEAPSTIYLSAKGDHTLVAWEEESEEKSGIRYVETTEDGTDWTEPVFLRTTPDLDFSSLHDILRGHTNDR